MTDESSEESFSEIWRIKTNKDRKRCRKLNRIGGLLLFSFVGMMMLLPYPMSRWDNRWLTAVVSAIMLACLTSGCFTLLTASWPRRILRKSEST